MKIPVLAALVLASLSLFVRADVLELATPITAVPKVITKPGIYTLKKNLVLKAGLPAAITIATADVIIDLGGHTIASGDVQDATNTGIGILMSTGASVTVRNGTLRGFQQGLSLFSSSGRVLVQRVQCDGSVAVGMRLNGFSVDVEDCSVRETGHGSTSPLTNIWGMVIQGTFSKVSGCEVLNTNAVGGDTNRALQIGGSALAIVEHCRVTNAGSKSDFGIVFFGGVGNFATDNSITNMTVGLSFANSAPGKFMNNFFAGCITTTAGGTGFGVNN